MSEITLGTLSITFGDAETIKNLQLEFHIGTYTYGRGVPIRLYPAVNAKLAATKGSAELAETRTEKVSEIVAFSGSTGNLKRERGRNFKLSVITDISFDLNGNQVYPKITYNEDQDRLESDIAFFGAVQADYDVDYKLIYYLPDESYAYQSDGSKLLAEWGYGTLFVFYEGKSTSLEITLTEQENTQWREFYRVVSEIVLDNEGAWEKPDGWDANPKDGTFLVGDHDIDPDLAFTQERIHEIGDVSKVGQLSDIWRRFSAPLLDPYKTAGISFTPKYYLKWASPPNDTEDPSGTWRAAFGRVDKNTVKVDLARRYPGIEVK